MKKEQKDKIIKALVEDRNNYAKDCNRRIEKEFGKIAGADYMLQRFLDVLRTDVEPQESEDKCKNCKYYRNPDYTRCHECEAESEDHADA